MGITYADLSTFGRLRKAHRLGPWGQFQALYDAWGKTNLLSPRKILEKIVHFNQYVYPIPTPSRKPWVRVSVGVKALMTAVGTIQLLRHKPAQDDHADAVAAPGGILVRRQSL